MIRNLSAPVTTFVLKFILSPLWIAGFGIGTLMLFLSGDDEAWAFLVFWTVGSFFIYNSCAKLKVVKIDGNMLNISNYVKNISLPISELAEIRESIFLSHHPILLSFRHDTSFGKKILFAPKGLYIFRRHPIAQELKDLMKESG